MPTDRESSQQKNDSVRRPGEESAQASWTPEPQDATAEVLRDSESRTSAIVDTAVDAIITADDKGIIETFNRAATRIFGYTREEVIGRNVALLMPQPYAAEHDRYMSNYLTTGVRKIIGIGREAVGKRKDGSTFPIELAVSEFHHGGRRMFAGIIRDITERKRAEEERERLNAQLREAHKMQAIGRLAGGIAHDFNNLMTIVLANASYLKSKRSPDHPEHVTLAQIEHAAETAGRLAHQLLVYAKGGKIRPCLVNFGEVVAGAMRVFKPSLPSQVRLDWHLASDLGEVECDVAQMEQVLVNLCRNAVDAMPSGGRLTVTAENVSLASPLEDAHPPLAHGDYVCVIVKDCGCGMTTDTLERLFEPFFTTKPNGYGLGLAALYGTVKSHGGAVSVTTRLGAGSTFRVWLPRARTGEERPATAEGGKSVVQERSPRKREHPACY